MKDNLTTNSSNEAESPAFLVGAVIRSCRSCGEEWKDDFWCSSSSRLCLNCCPNAYGMATCCGGVCKPVEQKAKPTNVDDKMPF